MLRSTILRASRQCPLTTSLTRPLKPLHPSASRSRVNLKIQQRHEATIHPPTHAISNPELANIEKRWEQMEPQEQAELWMKLRDRMKTNWHDLTWMEKKASYWVAFGPHGPRATNPKGYQWKVFWTVLAACTAATAFFFFIRMFALPAPRTMTREWQETTNEYLKDQKSEPISGISSEGYSGKGYVQSRPAKRQ